VKLELKVTDVGRGNENTFTSLGIEANKIIFFSNTNCNDLLIPRRIPIPDFYVSPSIRTGMKLFGKCFILVNLE
jgi:hypothetical protein